MQAEGRKEGKRKIEQYFTPYILCPTTYIGRTSQWSGNSSQILLWSKFGTKKTQSRFVITECCGETAVAPLHSHALLLYDPVSTLIKKNKYKDKGEIPGDVGVLGFGCGFAGLNAVSFTGWALMAV